MTVIPKNRAPIASVATTSISVVEGGNVELDASSSSDPDGDSVAYSWSQTSGTSVSLSNSSSAIASFTAPQVSASTNLGFQVVVTDGPLESSANVTVTVTNQATTTPPTTTTPPATGGGGGGSIGYFGLLFLMLIAYRRRETPAKITR